ncbi:MAG: glycoside hydrolase family 113, partial [Myxococcota bacterium]
VLFEEHWRRLIEGVRRGSSSRLYYSANWDHFEPIRFWDALDEVGVTAYFELTRSDDAPSSEQLRAAWRDPARALKALRERTGRPLIVTELGYPSIRSAARYPWDETRKAPLDLPLQAQLYDAACKALSAEKAIDGLYFWNWFGFGGTDDGTYTPRGKPAAASMRRCLAQDIWDTSGPAGR